MWVAVEPLFQFTQYHSHAMRRFSLDCGILGEYSRRGSCVWYGSKWWFVGGVEKGGGSPRHRNFGGRLHRLHNREMNEKLDNADYCPIVWMSAQSWPKCQPSSLESAQKVFTAFLLHTPLQSRAFKISGWNFISSILMGKSLTCIEMCFTPLNLFLVSSVLTW